MADKYRRRYTPQTREHGTKVLPQINPNKVHFGNDLEVRLGNFGLSAKKPQNYTDMSQATKTLGNTTKMREKSAGARIDSSGEKRNQPIYTEPDPALSAGLYRHMQPSSAYKDYSPAGKISGQPPQHLSTGFSAAKRGHSSAAQDNSRFYSSYLGENSVGGGFNLTSNAQANTMSWPRAPKPNFSIKPENTTSPKTPVGQRSIHERTDPQIPNKSAADLLSSQMIVKSMTGAKLRAPSYMSPPTKGSDAQNRGLTGAGPVRAMHKSCPRFIPKLDPPRSSTSSFNFIKSYSVNTCKGLVRPYNEDRVSIILNMIKPEDKKCRRWPVCSFFGVISKINYRFLTAMEAQLALTFSETIYTSSL